jgi:hypothetical protein
MVAFAGQRYSPVISFIAPAHGLCLRFHRRNVIADIGLDKAVIALVSNTGPLSCVPMTA